MTVTVVENESELIQKLANIIEKTSNEALNESGVFKVAVSGGSVLKFLTTAFPTIKTDFSKWVIFFCDERVVPFDDAESTFGVYKRELVGKIFEEKQFVKIKQGVSAEEAAADYIQQMEQYFPQSGLPRFDLLLLGMGPDGHTCSLFPGHVLLDEQRAWVAAIGDSPKPPPQRITLTLPVVNSAKNAVFAVAGEGKAEVVKRILANKEDLPAGRVQPTSGNLYWILDRGAAKLLK